MRDAKQMFVKETNDSHIEFIRNDIIDNDENIELEAEQEEFIMETGAVIDIDDI